MTSPVSNVIVQLNLIELNLTVMPVKHVIDPNTQFIDTSSRPAPGPKTKGPHRYTIMAPHNDESIVNVGAGADHRIKDDGITGRTKSHVHWHATAAPNTTMAALGGPTKEGWAGFQGKDNLGANNGFMVVTENFSWMEAEKHQYFLSRNHDIVVRTAGKGRRAVIQADLGEIDLVAKKHIYGAADGIALSALEIDPDAGKNYQADWDGKVPKTSAGSHTKNILLVLGAATAAHDLALKAKKTYKKKKSGDLKYDETLAVDAVKWLGDAVKFGLTVPKLIKMFTKPPAGPGCVKIGADSDVGIMAGGDASLLGGIGASMSSAIWTSVSAGVSASMKASLFAGLGSMYTSIKGYRKVEIGSDYGKTLLKADKDVEVSAETGALKMGGKTYLQATSDTDVYVGGGVKLHAAAGGGAGMGLLAKEDEMFVGALTGVDKLKAAAKNDDTGIDMKTGSHLHVLSGQSSAYFEKDEIIVRAPKIKLSAESGGNVTVNGAKILLE